jgi:DNA ligase (NAD+)
MTNMDADPKAEIENLRAQIAEHDRLYYKETQPRIDDQAYDRLKEQLADLETAHPQLARAVPSVASVGDDRIDGFVTRIHRMPMLSLDNTYNMEELIDFGNRLEKRFPEDSLRYLVEPKIDGVAVCLTYEEGHFTRAVTRGNGTEGDEITANVQHISGIPATIEDAPEILEVRGEIYMRHAEFERINAEREANDQPLYANPRNLAAGTVKLLDPNQARERRLEIALYGIGACQPEGFFSSQSAIHEKLAAWEFRVLEKQWLANGIKEAAKSIEALDSLRQNFDYPTDGAVIKLDDFRLQRAAGSTAKAPRWAIAYKFEAERAQTRLEDIQMQIGRTGAITPVAILQPVQLAGTVVARATLHNEDESRRKDLRPGDTVVVQKAGEIIPQVLSVVESERPGDSQPFDFAAKLRELGIEAARDPSDSAWRVLSSDAPALQMRALQHFASRACMDIANLGTAIVEQLVLRGMARDPADLYSLQTSQLLELDKFAEKSAANLIDALEKSKSQDLWRLLHGLGIPHVGKQSAKDLAAAFGSLDSLAIAPLEQLESIDGVGTIMAQSLVDWFANPTHQERIDRLRAHGVNFSSANTQTASGGALSGKTLVLTGALPGLTRDEATQMIEAAGGRTSSSVSQKTDYLLAGEASGSKYSKAQKLGIPVLDEAGFRELIEPA